MAHDVSVIGLYILDVLGRPMSAIPEGGIVSFEATREAMASLPVKSG